MRGVLAAGRQIVLRTSRGLSADSRARPVARASAVLDGGDDVGVNLAGDVALEHPDDLFLGAPLPPGLTFTPNIFGGALITGSSPPSAAGTYTVTVTATNGVAPDAVQHVTFVFATTKTTTTLSVSPNAVFLGPAGDAHSHCEPRTQRGHGDFHPRMRRPQTRQHRYRRRDVHRSVSRPTPGMPCNYNGFGVFAPSVATNGVASVCLPPFVLAGHSQRPCPRLRGRQAARGRRLPQPPAGRSWAWRAPLTGRATGWRRPTAA